MEPLTNIQEVRRIVLEILSAPGGGYAVGDLKHTLVKSDDQNRFLVIRTGWFQGKDYYAVVQDVELADGKVMIHRDGAEEELADELVEAGIPVATIIKSYLTLEER